MTLLCCLFMNRRKLKPLFSPWTNVKDLLSLILKQYKLLAKFPRTFLQSTHIFFLLKTISFWLFGTALYDFQSFCNGKCICGYRSPSTTWAFIFVSMCLYFLGGSTCPRAIMYGQGGLVTCNVTFVPVNNMKPSRFLQYMHPHFICHS